MGTPRAAPKSKHRFPVPWGLFVALGVYALAVVGYIWATYWRSPEYQAAEHYAQALRLLGVDDGRKCTQQELERAFDHVLETARLIPDQKELALHAERLRWRFDERHFQLSEERKRRAEAVSALARRREQEKDPMLVVGLRDRGWGPEQLLEGPQRAALWSIPGGVLIILFWAYLRFSARAVREREHEADLRDQERNVAALGEFRRGLKTGAPPADDETRRESAPESAAEVDPARRVKSRSREAVKRVTSDEATRRDRGQRASSDEATRRERGLPSASDEEPTELDTGDEERTTREPGAGVSRPPSQSRAGVGRPSSSAGRPPVKKKPEG